MFVRPQTFSFLPTGCCVNVCGWGVRRGLPCPSFCSCSALQLTCTQNHTHLPDCHCALAAPPCACLRSHLWVRAASSPWLPWGCWSGTSCEVLGGGHRGQEKRGTVHCHKSSGLQWSWLARLLLENDVTFLMPDHCLLREKERMGQKSS